LHQLDHQELEMVAHFSSIKFGDLVIVWASSLSDYDIGGWITCPRHLRWRGVSFWCSLSFPQNLWFAYSVLLL
jgi:hypothetical protein